MTFAARTGLIVTFRWPLGRIVLGWLSIMLSAGTTTPLFRGSRRGRERFAAKRRHLPGQDATTALRPNEGHAVGKHQGSKPATFHVVSVIRVHQQVKANLSPRRRGRILSSASFPTTPQLFLGISRIIGGIDIGNHPRPNPVQLNHGLALGPGIVFHAGCPSAERTRRHRCPFSGFGWVCG